MLDNGKKSHHLNLTLKGDISKENIDKFIEEFRKYLLNETYGNTTIENIEVGGYQLIYKHPAFLHLLQQHGITLHVKDEYEFNYYSLSTETNMWWTSNKIFQPLRPPQTPLCYTSMRYDEMVNDIIKYLHEHRTKSSSS